MAFWIYHRRRPHWRLDGATYFVSWCVQRTHPQLSASQRDIVAGALQYFAGPRYELHAFVVMNDHVHVLVTPSHGHFLHDIVRSWKGWSARRIHQLTGQAGRLWQGEYYDRIIRNDDGLRTVVAYIARNPIERWPEVVDYRWLWVEDRHRVWAGLEARPT